jgi:hypothetical protein
LNRLHIYVLAAILTVVGLGIFLYKAYVLGFPLAPSTRVRVWNVEARVNFVAEDKPVKISLFIPVGTRRFAILDEHFVSSGYGLAAATDSGNRRATWSIRKAKGRQSLYYQAVIRSVRTKSPELESEPAHTTARPFEGPKKAVAQTLLEEIQAKSADTAGLVSGLVKRLSRPQPDDNVSLLLGKNPTAARRVRTAVRVLEQGGIPARMVHGIRLQEQKQDFSKKAQVIPWIEAHYDKKWHSFEPVEGKTPVPDDWFRWWRGPGSLVDLQGGRKPQTTLSVSPKVEEGIASAVSRGELAKPLLLKFSLFSLPVNTQAVYRVMLLVPLGAFVLVILRNIVGIKTFGTFMPVLIALAFRETGLLWGICMFSVVVFLGLGIRFYLESLKLLVVPRLSAVLIVVVGLMASLSVLTHHLGFHRGLSVALFPMVILTMTIERMCILWEERGPSEALTAGLGSLLAAALAFLCMNIKSVEHLVFVFPELLLVLLAANILLGRYSGYRLMDLMRFKALARG